MRKFVSPKRAFTKGLLRASSASLALALFMTPAEAQLRSDAEGNNAAAAAAAANPAAAPVAAPQAAPLRTIQHISVSGTQRVEQATVLTYVALREGDPYDPAQIDQALKTLYGTGLFSDVKVNFDAASATLAIRVVENPIVNQVVFEGNSKVSDKDLTKEVQIKPRAVFTRAKIQQDVQRIIEIYRRSGKFAARVDPQIIQRPQNRVDLIFSINEGPKLVVKRITIVGNESVLSRDIKKVMKTKPEDILSFLTKSGRVVPAQVEEDRAAIKTLYQNRGFADVEVSDIQTQPIERNGVELIVTINEGMQYRLNTLKIEGANITSEDEILGHMKMLGGQLFTPKGMGDDLKALRDFYGSRGYVDMVAAPEVLPAGPGAVDVTYRIDEGVQSYVNLINIQGNTRTQDRVIRRELAVKPGNVFDTTLVDVSKKRLENLNYFSRVDTAPADTIVPGRKDLNVIVEEKRTGSFNFGVGFSTIDSLLGFAELQQSNFDLFNWPSFTGGGQRFRIRGQYGLQRSDFVVALTEPWFMGQKLSVGVEGYYRNANFLSAVYSQSNLGVAFQARKQIWRALSARAEYRAEQIRIYNVGDTNQNDYFFPNGYNDGYSGNENVGPVIQNSAGTYVKSAVTGSLTWDTRDSLFLTRKGELVELTGFIAGGPLGGTVQDYGLSLEASKYFSLPFDLIFLVKGQLAIVNGWGNNKASVDGGYGNGVPIFDRLYLGGANNMRGFNFREVGPVDQYANPIGGNSLAYLTFELTFPIVSRVRGAVFSDMGFVNVQPNDFTTTNANVDIGIGLRLDLPIGPIRVDYGIPVIYDSWNGPPGKFNFNIGYQF